MKILIFLFLNAIIFNCYAQERETYVVEIHSHLLINGKDSSLHITVKSVTSYYLEPQSESIALNDDTIMITICYPRSLWHNEYGVFDSKFSLNNIHNKTYFIKAITYLAGVEETCYPIYQSDTTLDTLEVSTLTAIQHPVNITNLQLFPNPASESQELKFYAARPGEAEIELLDMTGRIINSIWNGHISTGINAVNANVKRINKGIYIYRIQTKENTIYIKSAIGNF
jgi:hypothetical protein